MMTDLVQTKTPLPFWSCVLLNRLRIATFPPLRSPITRVREAAPVGTEISLGLDEGTRIDDDIKNSLVKRLGRNRLNKEFSDARVACANDTCPVGMPSDHDDRHVRIGIGALLPNHLRKF